MKKVRPFGTWPSPVSAALVGGKSPQVSEPLIQNGEVYYLQSLPEEKNRCTIMRYEAGTSHSLLPRPLNVRSKVHEYGGGAYTVNNGLAYFVLADDQRIYALDTRKPKATPYAITADTDSTIRFADLQFDHIHKRLLAVAEDHSKPDTEATNTIVAISLNTNTLGELSTLGSGHDFYASPRISPDGSKLCWIAWDHPNMPWDATQLELCELDRHGNIINQQGIGDGEESLCQPSWSPSNELVVVSDRNNWWNLYRCALENAEPTLQNLIESATEFATPPWTFNMSTYGFIDNDTILATYSHNSIWKLCTLTRAANTWTQQAILSETATRISGISANNTLAAYLAADTYSGDSLVVLSDQKRISTKSELLDKKSIACAQTVCFPTSHNEVAHGFYYPPTNCEYQADGLPPAIVICHGGPTGASDAALNVKVQYWTSRGFAVFDVNYRGSTGYGKHYRQRLYNQWGELDVDDLCAAADYLVNNQLADPDKLIVKGSSAGGYSVLAALAFRDVFKAGVSLYGIADLAVLATDTHKFEARYLDKLIGPYPEQKDLYDARSPLNAVDNFSCPLLVFQGLEDKVVPPNQSELIVNAVKQKGLPVAYRTFADEGHGFRNKQNIETMLNDELYFYCKVFSIPLPENCSSTLRIDNLDDRDHY